MHKYLEYLRESSDGDLYRSFRVDWIYCRDEALLDLTLGRFMSAVADHATVHLEDKESMFYSYAGEEVVFIQRPSTLGYAVRQVADYLLNGPSELPAMVKGVAGSILFNPMQVFVFSSVPPSEYFSRTDEYETFIGDVHGYFDMACFYCALRAYTSKGIEVDENWASTSLFAGDEVCEDHALETGAGDSSLSLDLCTDIFNDGYYCAESALASPGVNPGALTRLEEAESETARGLASGCSSPPTTDCK